MDRNDEQELHRIELKHYLSEDELTLPDVEREELLLQRKLVDRGLLDEMDLIANRGVIQDAARKSASSRNRFDFWSWLNTFPTWVQWIIMIIGLLVLSSLYNFTKDFLS